MFYATNVVDFLKLMRYLGLKFFRTKSQIPIRVNFKVNMVTSCSYFGGIVKSVIFVFDYNVFLALNSL